MAGTRLEARPTRALSAHPCVAAPQQITTIAAELLTCGFAGSDPQASDTLLRVRELNGDEIVE